MNRNPSSRHTRPGNDIAAYIFTCHTFSGFFFVFIRRRFQIHVSDRSASIFRPGIVSATKIAPCDPRRSAFVFYGRVGSATYAPYNVPYDGNPSSRNSRRNDPGRVVLSITAPSSPDPRERKGEYSRERAGAAVFREPVESREFFSDRPRRPVGPVGKSRVLFSPKFASPVRPVSTYRVDGATRASAFRSQTSRDAARKAFPT